MRSPVPLWRLFAVGAAVAALIPAAGPVRDADAYWHVRLGGLILDERAVPTAEPWNFPALGRPWVPHAWLSEVVLALAHRAGGWGAVTALRLALGVALLALLARAVIRGTDAVVGPLVYAVAAVTVGKFVLDRPQLLALVLAAALLPLLDRARGGAPPHPLVALGLGWLWASLHASWPLLVAAFGLAAAGLVADRRRAALPAVKRLALGAVAVVAGAAVTPVGPTLLTRPFLVAAEAEEFLEWQPTQLWSRGTATYGLLLALLAVGWALSRRVPASEVVWGLGIAAFSMSAGRNTSFAALLLAPDIARRLSEVVPEGRRSVVPAWTVRAATAFGAVVILLLVAANPRLPTDRPDRLVAVLRAQPGERLRVLNAYHVGGYLTGVGDPRLSAAIDGRIDAYPRGYVTRYRDALNLHGDWRRVVDELDATHALVEDGAPLTYVLESQLGWRRLDAEGPLVLLAAP